MMMEEQRAIQEAASAGLKSMEHFIRVLSSSSSSSSSSSNHCNPIDLNNLDCSEITDFTVSKFKQVINLLNRTGHARFRRAPSSSSSSQSQLQSEKVNPKSQSTGHDFAKTIKVKSNPTPSKTLTKETQSISTTTSSFLSTITGDGSVSDGKIGPSIITSGKPPLAQSHRKRCHDATVSGAAASGKVSSSANCHCTKRRRKSRVKRTIRVANVGSFDKNDPTVGTGLVGAPACGDVMKLQIKVDENTGKIIDARFKTFGCGSAIASSSVATEWVKGKQMEEVLTIKNTEIAKHLSLPPVKLHCSMLAEDAIKAAVKDYEAKRTATPASGNATTGEKAATP